MKKFYSFLTLLILFGWNGLRAETVPLTSATFGADAQSATGQTVYATNHTADDALAISAFGFDRSLNANLMQGSSTVLTDGIPTGGHYFRLTPKFDGTVELAFSIHTTGKSVTAANEDGSVIGRSDSPESDVNYTYKFDVVGGKTYYVYSTGNNQTRYKALTYKIDIKDLRVRAGNTMTWSSGGHYNADVVVTHSGGVASVLPKYDYAGGGTYAEGADNQFIDWELDKDDVIQAPGAGWFSGSHYYVRYDYIKPGTTRATLTFAGNEDYNEKTAMCVFTLNKVAQGLEYEKAADEYDYAEGLTIGQVSLAQTNIGKTVVYKSSDTNVATVDDNGVVTWTGNSGNSTITASAEGDDYYEAASAEYKLIVNGTSDGPYLVWATQLNYDVATGIPASAGGLTGGQYRGSYYGQYFYANREKQTSADTYETVTGKDAIFAGYGNDQRFSAFAFKSEADIPDCFVPIPGQERVYWIKDKNWRTSSNAGLFWNNDTKNQDIVYSVDKPEMLRSEQTTIQGGQNQSSLYIIVPDYPSADSLEVYAEIPGKGSRNPAKISTRYLVQPGYFNFSIDSDEGVVNESCWIIPYVKIPDCRLSDFELIYATVDNAEGVFVEDGDAIYTGDEEDIGDYIEWKWSEPDAQGNQYRIITGIFPKIYGITAGQEANVTIHIQSKIYYDSEASYHVRVIAQGNDLFHWEMNDADGSDDHVMKTITMIQGDFIHMPGIVGNPNGNDDFSKAGSYKYMYSIEKGNVVLNKDAYFYREGVANYFFTDSPDDHSTPLIPSDGQPTDQVALVFKAIGLGNYYRNDTVMIYGNKPGTTYLWAVDAQTGYACTPICVVVKPRAELLVQKAEILKGMTYPYTWDFEHIDMTDIVKDATNGTEGNGGSYWRKRWDEDAHGVLSEKKYYQWNAPFNADYDDKDNNKDGSQGLRQRWFKDIAANGEYMRLFNGLMFNIAGLDYWEQKYTRFNVHEDGTCIYLEGGPHYVSMPGFGLKGNAQVEDGTRDMGSVSMGGLHNQINTIDYNCYEDEFVTTNSTTSYANAVPAGHENHSVKLVICAEGRRDNNTSLIYVGGKDMISTANGANAVDYDHIYKTIHLETGVRRNYVIEMDPYDDIFQEQIYLCTDNDVIIYWMGISSEPRDMRNDYEVFTYSYPKDMDMDKTNEMMQQWANTGDETGVSTDEGYTAQNGMGIEDVGFKAYYASDYTSDEDKLTLTEIPNYKFAASEGVLVYPTKKVADFGDLASLSGIVAKTIKDKKVTQVVMENGEPKVDPTTNHYVFQDNTYDYTYYYLPTYFIANAQNMKNYDENPADRDGVARGKEPFMNDGADMVDTSGDMPHNALPNKLEQSVLSTAIALDHTDNDGNKWISLGLTNEYIGRYLTLTDDEQEHKVMTGYLEDVDGNQYEETSYFDLIGPDVVRFYRANKAGTMKGRRSYLNLTWEEYNVDTYGKSGVSNGEVTAKAVRIVFDDEAGTDAIHDTLNGVADLDAGNDAWYNLNGIKVGRLSKGIYIHNGKKVVIK